MSEPMVIEQGPRHRLVVLPGGEQIIQHPKEQVFPIWSLKQDLPPEEYQAMVDMKLARWDDVEVIDYYVTAFTEDYRMMDGTVPVYVARMGVLYWPALPKGH